MTTLCWSAAVWAAPPVANINIVSKIYSTGAVRVVPWGLPVVFDASGSFDPDGGPLTFSWKFGDGLIGSGGPSIEHQYTFVGLPAQCVPTLANRIPPDLCPASPDSLTVILTIMDNEGLMTTTTLNLRLRRQDGIPFTDNEREELLTAIADAQATLNRGIQVEKNALKQLDEAVGNLFSARIEVLLSVVSGGFANLKAAASEDERALKNFVKAIKELRNATSPGGLVQRTALPEALKKVADSVLNRAAALDPCCDSKRRQAEENFIRGAGEQLAGDLTAAAEDFFEAYSKLKDVRLPFRIPGDNSDIPVSRPGAPLLEAERALIEHTVATVLTQLGASASEASARKSLQETGKAFSEARTAELSLNFRNAAAQDEGALKTITKAIKNLKGVNVASQVDLTLALRDIVTLALTRAQAKVGITSSVRRALEIFASGLQNLNKNDFSSAADDFLKAYGKLKTAPVTS